MNWYLVMTETATTGTTLAVGPIIVVAICIFLIYTVVNAFKNKKNGSYQDSSNKNSARIISERRKRETIANKS